VGGRVTSIQWKMSLGGRLQKDTYTGIFFSAENTGLGGDIIFVKLGVGAKKLVMKKPRRKDIRT